MSFSASLQPFICPSPTACLQTSCPRNSNSPCATRPDPGSHTASALSRSGCLPHTGARGMRTSHALTERHRETFSKNKPSTGVQGRAQPLERAGVFSSPHHTAGGTSISIHSGGPPAPGRKKPGVKSDLLEHTACSRYAPSWHTKKYQVKA